MSKLEDDIRKVLANGEVRYDLDKEESLFRQWAGIYRGKLRWIAVFATVESVVFMVLIVLAAIEFFQADETKWQICYATAVLLGGAAAGEPVGLGAAKPLRHSARDQAARVANSGVGRTRQEISQVLAGTERYLIGVVRAQGRFQPRLFCRPFTRKEKKG